jgi:hypothetical protein
MKNIASPLVLCALLISSGANAALVGSLDGKTVYDTDLNITWLSNANLASVNLPGSNTFGVSGINANGSMNWSKAQSWIFAMNAANYLGYKDWRLPTTLQPDASCSMQVSGVSAGNNCTGSEMGHLFYNELGGTAASSILSSSDPDLALFSNLQSDFYWSDTEYAPNTSAAWIVNFNGGFQNSGFKGNYMFALAVRDGQVAAVPVPAAAWLLGSGLLGLIGMARKRKAA